MTTCKLDRAQWKPFLERMSKLLEGKRAEVEVVSLKLFAAAPLAGETRP